MDLLGPRGAGVALHSLKSRVAHFFDKFRKPSHRPDPDLRDEDKARIIGEYLRLRPALCRLQDSLANRVLTGSGFMETPRRLGMMHRSTIVMDSEHDLTVAVDFAIHHERVNGLNVVERCARDFPPTDADELLCLAGLQHSWYSLFLFVEPVPGLGAKVFDAISGRPELLVDVNLSQSSKSGYVLASRVVPFDGYCTTTGAALPVSEPRTIVRIHERVKRIAEDGVVDVADLDAGVQADLQEDIVRACFAEHSSRRLVIADPGESPPRGHRRESVNVPTASGTGTWSRKGKIGRNEPCPCGSGEKFKRCCGRGVR
jgi:SEC-C motif